MNNSNITLHTTVKELTKMKDNELKIKGWITNIPKEACFKISVPMNLCDISEENLDWVTFSNNQREVLLFVSVSEEDLLFIRQGKDKAIVGSVCPEIDNLDKFIYEISVPVHICLISNCFANTLVGFNIGFNDEDDLEFNLIKKVVLEYVTESQNGKKIESYYEGYARILEEVNELWTNVKNNNLMDIDYALNRIMLITMKVLRNTRKR